MQYLLASHNRGKCREYAQLLSSCGGEVLLPQDIGITLEPEENGSSFEENSFIKAESYFRATGMASIADDSGLVVDALNGAPGIYSARFGAPECRTDEDRWRKLLSDLENVPDPERTARFVCAITCILPDKTVLSAYGVCEGRILFSPRGEDGFGYDPIFLVPELGKSFAELEPSVKNQISHRARAFQEFYNKLLAYQEEHNAL